MARRRGPHHDGGVGIGRGRVEGQDMAHEQRQDAPLEFVAQGLGPLAARQAGQPELGFAGVPALSKAFRQRMGASARQWLDAQR